jgi:RimJ/RimL family protein N-acetyltransferase
VSSFEIRTSRLVLRQLTTADAGRIAELGGDWDVASMTSRMPYPYTVHAAHQWIDDLEDGEQVFGITHCGELTGVTGYMLAPDHSSAEIGYWIGKPYWGRGFATEAAQAIIDYCFKASRVQRITCGHFTDNPGSKRVIEKLGFIYAGSAPCWCEARRLEADAVRYYLDKRAPRFRLPSSISWLKTG